MNGKLQGIIICGVTAACLVGVMAFLNLRQIRRRLQLIVNSGSFKSGRERCYPYKVKRRYNKRKGFKRTWRVFR